MKKYIILYSMMIISLISCSESSNPLNTDQDEPNNIDNFNNDNSDNSDDSNSNDDTNDNSQAWLVPINEIKDGGPGKDGIPSIDNPVFVSANNIEAAYINNEDLVLGLKYGEEIKAYPHKILDYHEIVNDIVEGIPFSINYCPLTGTGFTWKGELNISNSTFGVSGLLYNSNLILYDRETDSNWSQMRIQCINGSQIGDRPEIISIIETTWATWKEMFPETVVMSQFTGFNRNYNNYPYGDYITNHDLLLFSVNPTNDSLPTKERVYSIIDGVSSKVYRFPDFSNGMAIIDEINGEKYLVVGNEQLIKSYKLIGIYSDLSFNYTFNGNEEFFTDSEGNSWNILGQAISGPYAGQSLPETTDVVSYWFAIAAFYPNPEIYNY